MKKLANQLKSMNDYRNEAAYVECSEKGKSALKTEPDNPRMIHLIKSTMCHCLTQGGDAMDAISICSQALKLDPEDVNVLCDRAEAHLNNDDYDEGMFLSSKLVDSMKLLILKI